MKYLLDSSICIHFLHGKFHIEERIASVGWENCCISEITQIELLYGAECSDRPKENSDKVIAFCNAFEVLPITPAIRAFVQQKARLRKIGKPIEDFDLLIAASAIAYKCTLVSENIKHHARVTGLKIENWVKRNEKD